jgi:hypothetical protein
MSYCLLPANASPAKRHFYAAGSIPSCALFHLHCALFQIKKELTQNEF